MQGADYDVVIVGAGPAGLNAALVLARCRRSILICDSGNPRNRHAQELHGFLTRDGTSPGDLLRIGREELARYPDVTFRPVEVVDASRLDSGFRVQLDSGETARARMLLLATGVVDRLPEIEGIDAYYGRGVFHCPYCDGWEQRDRAIVAYGKRSHGVPLALELTCWSRNVTLCTDGPAALSEKNRKRLERAGISVCRQPIGAVEGSDGRLSAIVLDDGSRLPCEALFFKTAFRQHSVLCELLGCDFTDQGAVDTGTFESTNVPGLYVAGDASKNVQLAIVAAAEGAQAAFAINNALIAADLAH